jgi:hypothetical protein
MTISKEEFFSEIAKPLAVGTVEYNGKQYQLRQMNEDDGAKFELMLQTKSGFDLTRYRRSMIAMMLIDSDGNLIVDDADKLKGMSRELAGKLFEKCQELDGYKPGEVEAIAKNSEPAEN